MALESVPKYLALYELHDETITAGSEFLHVLANPTPWSARMLGLYRDYRIRNTYRLHFTAGQVPAKDAPYVCMCKTDIPAAIEQDFNDWYKKEHASAPASVLGCFGARRFLVVDGQPKYMAVMRMERSQTSSKAPPGSKPAAPPGPKKSGLPGQHRSSPPATDAVWQVCQ